MKFFSQRFFALPFVLLLAACSVPAFNATTTSTYYEYEGKTYEVQDFRGGDTRNVTMFEYIGGERKFRGFYTTDEDKPEEAENKRNITTVVENGAQIGEPEKKSQRSFDLTIRDDE